MNKTLSSQTQVSHLPDVFGFRDALSSIFPRLVSVVVGRPCDANCPHCFSTSEKNVFRDPAKTQFLDDGYFRKIAEECAGYRDHTVIRLTSYGETLLHPHVVDLVEYTRNLGVEIGFFTHGCFHLTREVSERLVRCGVESIEISAEAPNKEIYRRIKIGLDFDNMLRNVRDLRKMRDKMKGRTFIIVSIVYQPAWNEHINEAIKFWSTIADHVTVRSYLTWGINKLVKRQASEKIYLDSNTPCPYPFERIQIDPDGYIRLCSYDIREKISPFGHIADDKLTEVWQGKIPRRDGCSYWNDIRVCHKNNGVFDLKSAKTLAPLCYSCDDRCKRSWTFNYREGIREKIEAFRKERGIK